MTYSKISELTAGSALGGTEPIPMVQSSATVYVTPTQMATYVAGTSAMTAAFQALSAGITNTVQITGEHQLTEDNELDYSASFTDGMSAATVTFTQLPATTVAIHARLGLADTGTTVELKWKRTSGGTQDFSLKGSWADVGSNVIIDNIWMPTGGNTIYVTAVTADVSSSFKIIGYKTGA